MTTDSTSAAPAFPNAAPTIPQLLATVADRFGDRVYLIAESCSLTYADLERRSARLARTLIAEGIGKRDHVGILMPNSVDWAIAWFATTRIGAVAVPLNTFYKPKELAWTARHADLRAILTVPRLRTNDFPDRLEEAFAGLAEQKTPGRLRLPCAPYLRTIAIWGETGRQWATTVVEDRTAAAAAPHCSEIDLLADIEACVTPADDCVIVYTSGSTGDPKGPRHSHGTMVRHSRRLTSIYLVEHDDVLFTAMPFFWIGGLMSGIHGVIHHGATLVTQPVFDAAEALELIEKHRATTTLGWPQQGKTLAEQPGFATRDLSSVRRTSMPATVDAPRRPPATGALCLGMTELAGVHLGEDPYVAQPEHRRGAYGPSLPGLTHRIVAPDTGEPVPTGATGEIWVRGYALMQGFHKREREEVFTADGFYRTGDAGFADADGWITYTGRLGDMIKTGGGVNVTPADVEAALTGCPGVLEAYVVGARDPRHGEVVAAAVVPQAGAGLDAETLRTRVKSELSAYKVPKHIWITGKQHLPFTDTGKLKRPALADLLTARIAESHTITATTLPGEA
ncbi:class I adenylate-forming enzyme family protein [Nocardia vaccinii]|uniref:class I adenylate-forming enzyme family protein n=1 Tax=Nocardia vaccinii TaxID=1822 RepID=UPI00082E94DF|nr:class I adenylate-forming enzyme family protein [Nocardia vaccinii]